MADTQSRIFPRLADYIQSIIRESDQLPEARKRLLSKLASYIQDRQQAGEAVRLTFICTHNSRRSHISQIWAATAAAWYGLDGITSYSGGTEATAFNPRAVAALERAGFKLEAPGGANPHYRVHFSADAPPVVCYSKTYDDPVNPQKDFAAIMTCSDADENCPFIPGVDLRLALTYDDPKEADGTPQEAARYDERVRQIGQEIFYAMQMAKFLKDKKSNL